MDKFKIDSHKLIYHIPRVHQWLEGVNIYPIYVEVGLYGGCNHRCVFCAFDFLNYKPDVLNADCLRKFLSGAAEEGIKAILYSGEGEPLLHKDILDIIHFTKKSGIDTALSTNGVLLNKDRAEKILRDISWVRVSLDAGAKGSYARIHGTRKEDFDIVISNLKQAVEIRNKNKLSSTVGVQFLLISQNYKEVIPLANILSDIGVDYLVLKPYCFHPSSHSSTNMALNYKGLFSLEDKLRKYSRDNFQIVFRRRAMEKLNEQKPYKHCLGLSFAAHISATGDVYPCNVFVGRKEFTFGNICREKFRTIWMSERRKKVMEMIYNEWDLKNCRNSCRLDEINRYLWELKNPGSHVNFI